MNKINLRKGILLFLVNGTIALSKVPKVHAEEYVPPVFTTKGTVNMRLGNSKPLIHYA